MIKGVLGFTAMDTEIGAAIGGPAGAGSGGRAVLLAASKHKDLREQVLQSSTGQ